MNSKKKKTLKFGSRKFISLLFTSSLSTSIVFILLLSDTIIAGQMMGENAVSAVNLVLPIFSISAFFTVLIIVGTANNYSSEMGNFNKRRADEFFGQGLILSIIVGVILFIFTTFCKDIFFSLIDPPSDLLNLAYDYYKASPLIVLLYPISTYLSDMVCVDGDELIGNLSCGVRIIVNIVASIYLTKYFGIKGIGYGSLIAISLSLIISSLHFYRKKNSLKFVFHLNIKDIIDTCKNGITDGEEYLCSALMVYGLNVFVTSYLGSEYLPVLTVILNIFEMMIIFDGIGRAFTPLISIYLSENNNYCVKDIMRSANISSLIEGLLLSILLVVFAKDIPSFFGIDTSSMITYYTDAIYIIASTCFIVAMEYTYSSYYLMLDKIYITFIMTLFSGLLVPLIVGIPLCKLIGINGLWIGMSLSSLIALLICSLVLLPVYGKKRFPLLLDPKYDSLSKTYDVVLSKESIIELRDEVENYLINNNVAKDKVNRVMLMIEECCLLILNRNNSKKVYLQCCVYLGDQNKVILRDTGVVFNLTDSDLNVVSINAFLVGILMWKQRYKQNLTTMGYNRNEFIFNE